MGSYVCPENSLKHIGFVVEVQKGGEFFEEFHRPIARNPPSVWGINYAPQCLHITSEHCELSACQTVELTARTHPPVSSRSRAKLMEKMEGKRRRVNRKLEVCKNLFAGARFNLMSRFTTRRYNLWSCLLLSGYHSRIRDVPTLGIPRFLNFHNDEYSSIRKYNFCDFC